MRVLKLQTSGGGNLVNTTIYRYVNGKLIKIPVTTESLEPTSDTWSNGGSGFEDIDKDGIKELLIYYWRYPRWEVRTVNVYKFNGKAFWKSGEYEEPVPEI